MKSIKKKVGKILLSLTVVLAMLLTIMPTNVFANEAETNVGWTYPDSIIGKVGDTVTLSFSFTDQNGVKAQEYYIGDSPAHWASIGLKTTNETSGIMNFKPDENGNLNFSGTLLIANPTFTVSLMAYDVNGETHDFNLTYPIANEKKVVTVTDGIPDKSEYAKDETVTITANVPATGKQFKEWTVVSGNVTLADATSSTTTFTMPAEDVEVTATYEDIPHIHTPSTTWSKDGTNHWHECAANDGEKMDLASHAFGDWVTDTSATKTTAGSKHRDCTVCGQRETVEIPATGVATAKPSSPQTGDTSNAILYLGFIALSGCVAVFGLKKKKSLNRIE